MLVVDHKNPRAVALHQRLDRRGAFEGLPEKLCAVIGGDGWMLSTIRELGPGHTYLGLNAGTLGFLLNDVDDDADVAHAMRAAAWTVYSFPRVGMVAVDLDGQEVRAEAVNDLYIERRSGHTAHLILRIGGEVVVPRLVCDGLLVSTALGSTAYNFSAGGVPAHPLIRALCITPVCPHAPRLSPFLLPMDAVIEVEAVASERRPVGAVADGVDLGRVARMRVQQDPADVDIAFLEGHHFTRTLVRKVLR